MPSNNGRFGRCCTIPTLHIARNPLNINDTEVHTLAAGSNLLGFVEQSADLQGLMLVAIVNGDPRLRADWVLPLRDGDVVLMLARPRGGGDSNPLRVLASLAVLAFAGWAVGAMGLTGLTANVARAAIVMTGNMLVNQIMPLPTQPESRQLPEPSPTYSLRGQSNMARIGQPIPLHYGRHIIYPDLVMSPYYEYDGKDQWYHVLLCAGLGHIKITDVKFGDVPVSSLDAAAYAVQVIHPGGAVTLLPATVYTASVSGLELTNSYSTAGFACPPAATVNEIGVDVAFNGLVKVTRNGDLQDATVTLEVQARPVNDVDAPLADWSVIISKSFTAKVVDALRETVRVSVTPARYEVRARVTAAPRKEKDPAGNTYRDVCIWGGLRGYSSVHPNYGDCTLLAVKIKANELLSQQSTQQISCVGTRHLKHWTKTGGWSGLQASRSIVWALVDAYLNPNNGNQPENTLLLEELEQLEKRLHGLSYTFDYRFDESGAKLLPTMNLIARAGRSIVVHHIGRWRVLRDEPRTVPVQMFTADNMRDFSVSISAPQDYDPDAVIGKFIDADTWQQATLTYSAVAEPLRPTTVDLPGVTSRQQAWDELVYLAKAETRRESGSFVTGLEGRIPVIYDLIAVCPEGVDWGYYGHVVARSGNTLTLSNPVPLTTGKLMLRNQRGGSMGVFDAGFGADGTEAIVTGLPAFALPDMQREPIYYIAGETDKQIVLCKVTELKPQADDMVQIGFVVEDQGVYLSAGTPPTATPPVVGGGGVNLAIPWLTASQSVIGEGSCKVTFAWGAAPSAELYEAEYKINEDAWTQAAVSGAMSYTLEATPSQQLAFRVRAKAAKGIGAYQSVSVTACGAVATSVPDPGMLALEAPFIGPVLKVMWSLTAGVAKYRLRIYDTATMTLRRDVETTASRYDYTYLDAIADGGTHRNMTLRLHTTRNGIVSDVYSQLVVSNPQIPALAGLQVASFNAQIGVTYTAPPESDWAGILVYRSETKGFTPSASTLVYSGSDPVISLPVPGGSKYYVRVAGYDFWGRDNLALSAEFECAAQRDLDALSADLNNVPAVVDSAIKSGVNAAYITGQITKTQIADGSISTPKLMARAVTADKIAANAITADKIAANAITTDKIAANAITADKLFVANLAAISANMGTVTTGKLQNASGRAVFNLDALGASNVIELRDPTNAVKFAVAANGRATFTGSLTVNDPDSGLPCYATATHVYSNNYIASALNPSASIGVKFMSSNLHSIAPIAQRIRNSSSTGLLVPVIVTATAVLDHYFTIWYGFSGNGPWFPLVSTYEPGRGDGSVTLNGVAQLRIDAEQELYLSATATNTSGGVFNHRKPYLINLQMSAMVVNI